MELQESKISALDPGSLEAATEIGLVGHEKGLYNYQESEFSALNPEPESKKKKKPKRKNNKNNKVKLQGCYKLFKLYWIIILIIGVIFIPITVEILRDNLSLKDAVIRIAGEKGYGRIIFFSIMDIVLLALQLIYSVVMLSIMKLYLKCTPWFYYIYFGVICIYKGVAMFLIYVVWEYYTVLDKMNLFNLVGIVFNVILLLLSIKWFNKKKELFVN